MVKKQTGQSTSTTKVSTLDQVSAGGVAFRWKDSVPEIAVVSMKPKLRWQLPKGIVDPGESPEITAVREVREEAGIETDLLSLIETIEYWYRSTKYGKPVRFHKFVHFYLLQYRSGNVADHDNEVAEAKWVSLDKAIEMLAFKSEREVVEKTRGMILKQ
ncbi:MAG TPA: NUDIX hydrolase [Anaerolineales bacterium]|nr:NUDIX hydrolase [Anaerolineales bacterium]